MEIIKKSTKLVLSFLMIITCSNFFTVRAEDGEETNYSEPVLVETVNEETTSDSLEEVLDEPVIEEVIGEEVIDETVVAEEVESVVETEPSKLVVKSENEEQLEDEEVEEEIVLSRAMRKVAPVYDATTVIEVPVEEMNIVNGVFKGIKDKWYTDNFPGNQKLKISLAIPESVKEIGSYAFDAANNPKYTVVKLDLSNAKNLIKINTQAFKGCIELTGVLDLSNTKLESLGKFAFCECKGLTGVIFPQTLKEIGNTDGGSVFKDCTNLQFVRVAGGNLSANFELPGNLEKIYKHSFYGCTGFPDNTTVTIPSSVTLIGEEAFYKTSKITTIYVEADNASGYHSSAFKGNDYGVGKRLTIFKNAAAKNTFTAIDFHLIKIQ